MTVAGILVAELGFPTLDTDALVFWLVITVLSWIVRLGLFRIVQQASPPQIARSIALRLLPLAIVAIACSYWVWTIYLFGEQELSIKTVFFGIGLLCTTIAMTANWYATPIATIVYNFALWGSLSGTLFVHGQASIMELIALNASVFVILRLFVINNVSMLNSQLQRADQLARMSDELRRSNAELEAMKAAAVRDLDARSKFFAEVSHDFKQRLHGAKMIVLTARARYLRDLNPLNAIDRLVKEVDVLEGYFAKVLDLIRLECSQNILILKTIALQSVFQSLELQFEAEAGQTGRILKVRHTGIQIATDSFMLERMLGNLVSNALRHTRCTVLVAARRHRGGVSIEVWDQGPGIEESAQVRLFDAFHQIPDTSSSTDHQGVGLGLAVVSKLSQHLGYTVSLSSQVGRGSVFRIWVPPEFVVAAREEQRREPEAPWPVAP
jgi:signal transduction histidine kinase